MKLFFRFCIFISFLLLFYTIYRSEIFWKGQFRDYYYIYWIILIALVIFFSITLQLNHKIQKYVAIVLLSVVVSLYLFEGYYRFGSDVKDLKKWIVYNDLKKKNKKVAVAIVPNNFLNTHTTPMFLSGISGSKTIHCNESGYYSIYQSDRYGFNNPDEEWNSNYIEYFLVGDSLTHGACVNRPDDIGSVLRKLSKKNVLNLGYSGNGPLLEYATLREYLKPGVKKILWLYYSGNDLQNLDAELKSTKLIKYLQDFNYSQDLKSKQNEIDKLLLSIENYENSNFLKKKILNFIKLYKTRELLRDSFFLKQYELYDEFRNILEIVNNLSIKNNSTLYFVYLPVYEDLAYGKEHYAKSQLVKITSELNIPFIDIENDVFKKEANPLKLFPFERYGHYTVEGYKKTALKIYDKTK